MIPLVSPLPGSSTAQLVIPKGTVLAIPVNVVQQDPEVWGADADGFRASRWLERSFTEEGDELVLNQRDLLVFGQGPRKCLGSAFAVAEIKVMLVHFQSKDKELKDEQQVLLLTIIQNFALSCHHDIEPFQSFVVRPRVLGEGASSLPLVVKKM